MSKFHYIVVLIVVLTIATLTYQLSTSIEQSARKDDPDARHDPDYFISDFSATMYEKNGATSYRLLAKYLEHFPDDDTVHVTDLNLKIIDEKKQQWFAISDSAIGYENIKVLQLEGNVNIRRPAEISANNTELFTDKLRIDLISRQASTKSKVKIIGKNSTIVATGMELDLKNGNLVLKSEAKGQYAPD